MAKLEKSEKPVKKAKAETAAKPQLSPGEKGKMPGRSICIICQQEKSGYSVRDDFFINLIRSIKQTLGIASNNKLVVCEQCVPEHKKRRSGFEKTLLQYGVFGAVLGLILLVISRSLAGLAMALLMFVFMIALAVLHYHPASEALSSGVNVRGRDVVPPAK